MALTTAQIQNAYVAFFNRPADVEGLNYWLAYTGNSAELLNTFAQSAEYKSLYSGMNNTQLVNAVYQNLFGHAPDIEGLNYWVNQLTQGKLAIGNIADAINKGAQGTDATIITNKVAAAGAFTTALDTTAEVVAYASVNSTGLAAVKAWLAAVTSDAATVPTTDSINTIIKTVQSNVASTGSTFTLTEGTDVASANVFNAGMVYTPGGTDRINALQDEDSLTGVGTNPTLNVSLGNSNDNGQTTVTPKMSGIETINVAFAGSGGTAVTQLDLQDTTGVANAINITRISDGLVAAGATIDNITSIPTDLSVANSGQPTQDITFGFKNSAVSGAADSVNVTISDVQARNLAVQSRLPTAGVGIETINLVSSGSANSLTQLQIEDAETLNISGEENLTLQGTANVLNAGIVEAVSYTAGLGNVAGSLSLVDASGLEGDLVIALGGETIATKDNTSGQQVNFTLKGAAGNDNVVLVNGMNAGDSLDLGTGANNLTVLASTQTGAVINAQTLTVLNQANAANVIGVDAGVFTGLTTVVVRNEGQNAGASAAAPMTTNLLNLAATPAGDITVQHGTTGNNGLLQNILNVDVAAGVTAVTVKLADATNANPRFNLNLTTDSDLTLTAAGAINTGNNNANGANAVTTLTLADGDSESNTVQLSAQGYTAAGALRADSGTTYTTVNLTGAAQAGKFLNLDAGLNAYGLSTDGTAVAASANRSSALTSVQRDTIVANAYANTNYADVAGGGNSIGYALAGAAANVAGQRLIATKIDASAYAGDVIVRVGQADQAITTGSGNDTIVFDAINDTRAGLTITDTVKGGTGVDTIVIDGGNTIAATQIALGASEWTNLSGIDVLRLGTNDLNGAIASTYSLTITDQLVGQADAANRITIINNDGDLRAIGTSNATIDMRQSNGLSATKFVNFYGENGDTAGAGNAVATAANRVILSDATANGGHILNGGDRDLNAFATAAAWNGAGVGSRHNGNTIEYRNTSVVTAGDQVGISNFANVVFNNDQAIAQTLTLELTTTVADALADASHVAASDAQETLNVRANDASFASVAGAALNIEGRTVSNAFIMNIRSDDNGGANNRDVADTINLNDNVGGSAGHTVDLLDGGTVADTLSLFGAAGDTWSAATTVITVDGTTNTGTVTVQNATGLATAVHTLNWDNIDVIRLTNDNGVTFTTLQAGTSALTFNGGANADTINGTAGANTINGNAGNDTISAGAGNDTVTGGTGVDNLTGGTGADTFVFATSDTGITLATADTITDFVTAADFISTSKAAGAGTIANGSGLADFAAFVTAADAVLTAGAGNDDVYISYNAAASGNAWVVVDENDSGSVDAGDTLIVLTGVDLVGEIALANFL